MLSFNRKKIAFRWNNIINPFKYWLFTTTYLMKVAKKISKAYKLILNFE